LDFGLKRRIPRVVEKLVEFGGFANVRQMLRVLYGLLLAVFFAAPSRAEERVIDFSQYSVGKTPPGFRSALAGQGKPGDWRVILDKSDSGSGTNGDVKVLAQLSQDGTDEHFPMLILDPESYGDFTLTTRLKLVDGLFEQMAGIAFRLQDTNNYYYVRASGIGKGSFRFITVVNGQRATPIGPEIEIKPKVWHNLSIECKGNRITFLFDGKQLIPPATDNTFSAGKIAFWTKSDAVSYFGETRIHFTPRETLAKIIVRESLRRYPRLAGLRIYALGEDGLAKIIASSHADEIGEPGTKVEQDVIARDVLYAGKAPHVALVTMPLHDRNGEVAGAVRVVLDSFPGQTEQNAIARARPVVKDMEQRVRTAKDLLQ
jgi:hypothetical protein